MKIMKQVLSSILFPYSKKPILGLAQEWFRELSFSKLECGVHESLFYEQCYKCGQ